jgi:DNA-binding CsgD family transcriptional regulator
MNWVQQERMPRMASATKTPGYRNMFNFNPAHAKALIDSLTPRERQVAELIAMGLQQKEIAKQLHVSPKTLDIYRGGVRAKLGVPVHGIPRIWFCAVARDRDRFPTA